MLHRLFIAINLSERIKKRLKLEQEKIKNLFSDYENSETLIKWVRPENFHITLSFLGSVTNDELVDITNVLKTVVPKYKTFTLSLSQISFGPLNNYDLESKKLPKLIWLRGENLSELTNLKGKLEKELFFTKESDSNHLKEQRFFPHITLGRIRQWQFRRIDPEEWPDVNQVIDLNFEVNSIELMESELKKRGPEYTTLESIQLSN